MTGERFCANCNKDFIPILGHSGDDGDDPDRQVKPCCSNPRIVNLIEFLRPGEYELPG